MLDGELATTTQERRGGALTRASRAESEPAALTAIEHVPVRTLTSAPSTENITGAVGDQRRARPTAPSTAEAAGRPARVSRPAVAKVPSTPSMEIGTIDCRNRFQPTRIPPSKRITDQRDDRDALDI